MSESHELDMERRLQYEHKLIATILFVQVLVVVWECGAIRDLHYDISIFNLLSSDHYFLLEIHLFKVFSSSFLLSYSILTFLVFISSPVPASRNEYQTIKQQLEVEKIPGDNPGDPPRSFHSLTLADQAQMEKKRLQGVFYNSTVMLTWFFSQYNTIIQYNTLFH